MRTSGILSRCVTFWDGAECDPQIMAVLLQKAFTMRDSHTVWLCLVLSDFPESRERQMENSGKASFQSAGLLPG